MPNNGVICFDLRIIYHGGGNTGLRQTVMRTVITKSNNVVFNDYGSTVNTGHRMWMIEGNKTETRVAKLHNAVASDRGVYFVTTELNDPAAGTISVITKRVFVTGIQYIYTLPFSHILT